ncbi:hypothetical protein [Xylophilus sp.]|uniref:hypothetical protein n=1 Tax=Xylophilus sp. TaxID=2653893 RepID=UPI0013BDE01F|nr:hypothetical protein [Xylophilus sp.]KAF1049321.1 MAG: hypothetical protein GAK38_00777 [Xylophilus sp.]
MTTKYRIFAHNGQVTAIAFGPESPHVNGIEVSAGESEDLGTTLAVLAPSGVGSPWPAKVAPVPPAAADASMAPKSKVTRKTGTAAAVADGAA